MDFDSNVAGEDKDNVVANNCGRKSREVEAVEGKNAFDDLLSSKD